MQGQCPIEYFKGTLAGAFHELKHHDATPQGEKPETIDVANVEIGSKLFPYPIIPSES